MTTIVNTPNSSDSGSGAAGWIVAAAVIIAVVLVAIFVWPGYGRHAATPAPTQINVQIPSGANTSSGGAPSGGSAQPGY